MKKGILNRKNALVFSFGAFVYGAIEILWRGYTHPAMLVLGGLSLCMIFRLEALIGHLSVVVRSMVYAIIITAAEFAFGLVLNIWLGLGVWDYSKEPFNLLGQICLPYFLLWFGLALVCCGVCAVFNYAFSE